MFLKPGKWTVLSSVIINRETDIHYKLSLEHIPFEIRRACCVLPTGKVPI